MKDFKLSPEKPATSHAVTSFQGVTSTINSQTLESQVSTRVRVIIDWAKGTMTLGK